MAQKNGAQQPDMNKQSSNGFNSSLVSTPEMGSSLLRKLALKNPDIKLPPYKPEEWARQQLNCTQKKCLSSVLDTDVFFHLARYLDGMLLTCRGLIKGYQSRITQLENDKTTIVNEINVERKKNNQLENELKMKNEELEKIQKEQAETKENYAIIYDKHSKSKKKVEELNVCIDRIIRERDQLREREARAKEELNAIKNSPPFKRASSDSPEPQQTAKKPTLKHAISDPISVAGHDDEDDVRFIKTVTPGNGEAQGVQVRKASLGNSPAKEGTHLALNISNIAVQPLAKCGQTSAQVPRSSVQADVTPQSSPKRQPASDIFAEYIIKEFIYRLGQEVTAFSNGWSTPAAFTEAFLITHPSTNTIVSEKKKNEIREYLLGLAEAFYKNHHQCAPS